MKCDVIIPVGPGHEQSVHRAVNSVAMAERYSKGPFTELDVIAVDDTKGEHGRSKARNEGVKGSTADWIFFLDADDIMLPQAFLNLASGLDWPGPHDYDAIWGVIIEYKEGVLCERFQYPYITQYKDILELDPYLTLQMGHFVKREAVLETPFDEDMNTGEDWDYYLRMWKSYNCVKIDKPFMANIRGEHSTGPRAANGVEWREQVEQLIEAAKNAP